MDRNSSAAGPRPRSWGGGRSRRPGQSRSLAGRLRRFAAWAARTAAPAGLVAAGGLLVASCIFSTRDPENPQTESVPFRDPSAPDSVLENIRVTLGRKYLENYNLSLDAGFTFVPAPEDVGHWGSGAYEGWGKNAELEAFTAILDAAGTAQFTWRGGVRYSDWCDDIRYSMTFRNTAVTPAQDTVFAGEADLYFRQDGTQWKLLRWEDKRVQGDTLSLGYLRVSRKVWG